MKTKDTFSILILECLAIVEKNFSIQGNEISAKCIVLAFLHDFKRESPTHAEISISLFQDLALRI